MNAACPVLGRLGVHADDTDVGPEDSREVLASRLVLLDALQDRFHTYRTVRGGDHHRRGQQRRPTQRKPLPKRGRAGAASAPASTLAPRPARPTRPTRPAPPAPPAHHDPVPPLGLSLGLLQASALVVVAQQRPDRWLRRRNAPEMKWPHSVSVDVSAVSVSKGSNDVSTQCECRC